MTKKITSQILAIRVSAPIVSAPNAIYAKGKLLDRMPSVADYFEQRLGTKLFDPFTGGDTIDRQSPASPAHPEFHIHTGCGIDCKAAIDAAALVLAYLQTDEESPDAMSAALIGANALLAFLSGAAPTEELISAAYGVLAVVNEEREGRAIAARVVPQIAAEIVNCYVYG